MWILYGVAIGILRVSFITAQQCSPDPKCWQYSMGCSMSGVVPFEKKTPITCQQCMDLCTRLKGGKAPYVCQSAVYDSSCQSCDIYAVQGRLTPSSPAKTYFQPFGSGSCGGGNNTGPGPTTAPSTNDCPSGQTAIVVAFKNSQSSAVSGGAPFAAASSDECLSFCQKNQDKSGASMPCKTAQFNGGQCTLSATAPSANSQGSLSATDGSYYYEKQCLPTGSVGNCKSILMDPKHILVGFNKKPVDASSYTQCLQACLDSQTANGFKCNSAQYFADATTVNCILNEETQSTQPDKYTATQDNVIYFEPKCGARAMIALEAVKSKKLESIALDIPLEGGEWTMWSDCTAGKSEKIRYRNCREIRISKCPTETLPCIGKNEVPESMKFKISKNNNEIVRKDDSIPLRSADFSSISGSKCEGLFDDNGKRRCDIGMKIMNNGVKKFCQPVDIC